MAGSGLVGRLPAVRGQLTPDAPLASQTWFRVGGPAEVLFRPADEEDLAQFLEGCPSDVPVTVLGVASNLLVRDGGVPGVVIRFGPRFARVSVDGTLMTAGAGSLDLNVARAAEEAGLTGVEFLCGIPGTVGGGLRMNAGAYGREFKDIVRGVTAFERNGRRRTLNSLQMGFGYRHTQVDPSLIFVSAEFLGIPGDPDLIRQKMQEIQTARGATQPIREKTGGSTFANPEGDSLDRKSWQLIDAAGCRGLKVGQAQVSEKHCNFLINTGNAKAAEIERLGEEVRRRVFEHSGVDLRWEIKRIGIEADATASGAGRSSDET